MTVKLAEVAERLVLIGALKLCICINHAVFGLRLTALLGLVPALGPL
jgi:hypothetical protein